MNKRVAPYVAASMSALSAGAAISALLLLALSKKPFASLSEFISGCFSSVYYFGSFLNTAALYMIAGCGASVAVKSGNLNLGGEGQIYVGGFTAAAVSTLSDALPAPFVFALALLLSMAVPAALSALSAFFKLLKDADVLLTSFLLSAAIIPFIDAMIAGHFRDHTGNLLSTPPIAPSLILPPLLKPSPLSAAVFAAPLLCLLLSLFLSKTASGRRLQVWGLSNEFAFYSGYSKAAALYSSLSVSGALHGLAGFIAVMGTYHRCHSGFYSGIGWNALSCALIAYADPLALIPAGLVLSWLNTSADKLALLENFGFDISSLIQGIILFCISARFAFKGRR